MSSIRVLIAFAEPQQQTELAVEVPLGTTLQQALALMTTQIAVLLNGDVMKAAGVWGKLRQPQYVLREGDRIELYRLLKADPKQARRTREGQQAKRKA